MHLDSCLAKASFSGDVIDVGGERKTSRGNFRPPGNVRSWKYVNLDPKTMPDFLASAEAIPVPDASFDCVKLTEVLEHVENPALVLAECSRVLRSRGKIVASVPFLFAVHGDPADFQRWTADGLRALFRRAGFTNVEVKPMGGICGVCADLFEIYCHHQVIQRGKLRFSARLLRIILRRVLLAWLTNADRRASFQEIITTGYFITATRAEVPSV